MNTVPISGAIAEFAAALRYEDLPEALREFARFHILDAVGVAIAATQTDFARSALAGLAPLADGGKSSLIGLPDKLALRDAVLMNGILAHGLDYDDTHTGSQVHPTVNAFPCAMGLAEFLDTGGRELLTAYVLGGEIATRVGIAANGTMQAQGFHNTGVAGHLGCAVTAAKLYNLNADQIAHAQGLAGSMASGISEYRIDGSWNKRMHPGWAGVGGISAASLARGGYVGASEVYEGKYGLFKTHAASGAEFNLGALTDQLGSVWRLQEAAIKPLPACHLLHACVDSALALQARAQPDARRYRRSVRVAAFHDLSHGLRAGRVAQASAIRKYRAVQRAVRDRRVLRPRAVQFCGAHAGSACGRGDTWRWHNASPMQSIRSRGSRNTFPVG